MVHSNINSVLSIFNQFRSLFETELDVLVHTETKIDQFNLNNSSKPHRIDKNKHGRGIVIQIDENKNDIENTFIEIFFRKRNDSLWWNEHEDKNSKSEPAKHLKENPTHAFTWSIISKAPENFRKRRVLEAYFIKTICPTLMSN